MIKTVIMLVTFLFSLVSIAKVEVPFQAIVIGADESYLQSEGKLNYATSDAKRVEKAMRTAGRVSHGSIRRLSNPTIKEVQRTIKKLSRNKSKKFMFYFSGHSNEDGLHLKDGSIGKAELHKLVSSVKADVKVVILDSCYSGALKTKGVRRSKAIELVHFDIDEPTGSVILT